MYAIKAVFRNGTIELLDAPPSQRDTRVLVIFPETDEKELFKGVPHFLGTKEMDRILQNEPDWKPIGFIEREE